MNEDRNAETAKMEKLQEMIVDAYHVHPSVAYFLTVIIKRFAEEADYAYLRGRQDAEKQA